MGLVLGALLLFESFGGAPHIHGWVFSCIPLVLVHVDTQEGLGTAAHMLVGPWQYMPVAKLQLVVLQRQLAMVLSSVPIVLLHVDEDETCRSKETIFFPVAEET